MKIRRATEADIPAIARGCLDLYENTPWKTIDMAPMVPDMAHLLWTRLQQDPSWALFVAEDDSIIAGFMGVELTTHYLHPTLRIVREWAMWVHPKYRGKKVAWELMQIVKAWGVINQAKGVLYSKVLTKVRPKRGPVEIYIWEELGV